MTNPTNQVPVRPAARDAIYEVVDGERDYQDAKYPGTSGPPEYFVGLIDKYGARIRAKEGDVQDNLRKIAGVAIRALEASGARPREWHVPASAGVTGTLHVRDLGDRLNGPKP